MEEKVQVVDAVRDQHGIISLANTRDFQRTKRNPKSRFLSRKKLLLAENFVEI